MLRKKNIPILLLSSLFLVSCGSTAFGDPAYQDGKQTYLGWSIYDTFWNRTVSEANYGNITITNKTEEEKIVMEYDINDDRFPYAFCFYSTAFIQEKEETRSVDIYNTAEEQTLVFTDINKGNTFVCYYQPSSSDDYWGGKYKLTQDTTIEIDYSKATGDIYKALKENRIDMISDSTCHFYHDRPIKEEEETSIPSSVE